MTGNNSTPEESLARLASHSTVLRPRLVLVVAQTGSAAPDLLRLQLTESLSGEFMRSDATNSGDWASRTLMQYIPGRAIPGGHLMWAERSSVTLLSQLNLDDNADRVLPPFDLNVLSSANLKMTITTSTSENDPNVQATFFRITRNTALLARTRRFAAIYKGGSFDSLKDEVVLFNYEIDAIAFGGYVYFSNRHMFERSFGFLEKLREHASETFELTTAGLAINELDEFRRAATSDINMMAKMASIRRKIDSDPRYAEAMTMENLLKFMDANPHIDVPVVGEGQERRFEFQSSPATRYRILKLLDDDFLKSGLTFLDYEVDSKSDPLK